MGWQHAGRPDPRHPTEDGRKRIDPDPPDLPRILDEVPRPDLMFLVNVRGTLLNDSNTRRR